MKSYQDIKERQQAEYEALPTYYAITPDQLKELKQKLGVENKDLVHLGYGAFVLKKDEPLFDEFEEKVAREDRAIVEDDDLLYQMFRYEMLNHEYHISCDTEGLIDSLPCVKLDDIYTEGRIRDIFRKAKNDFIGWCDEQKLL